MVVESVTPTVDGGRFAAKRTVGVPVAVEADGFVDGHDPVAGLLEVTGPHEVVQRVPLEALGNDRYRACFTPDAVGAWSFRVVAWVDRLGGWYRDLLAFGAAGDATEVLRQDGTHLLDALRPLVGPPDDQVVAAARLALAGRVPNDGLSAVVELGRRTPPPDATHTQPFPLRVDPALAACGVWYEMFPRSASPDPNRAGTLADVVRRLPYVAALGVDVLYLPPVHPIGRVHRKGPDNARRAGPGDPGSPWAIGNDDGGHDAVHPELGTHEDLVHLVETARRHRIEVALDLAWQAAPDHPWVREHPEWFVHRSDGSIQYAQNPPKRYEDIYPFDLEGPHRGALWRALLGVVEHWVDAGVRVFRVDNPHTKPFDFWEWLIAEVQARTPEVIFLSEAFTRPKVMHRLAKLGFTQSYTYFTWRVHKREIEEYFVELAHGPGRDYFRGNVWTNTPDILPEHLQRGSRATFLARLLLAAGLSSTYGFYGPPFELMVRDPRHEGSEEHLHSEKYEIRHWDLDAPHSLAPFIGHLNRVRRAHPALQRDDDLRFHGVDNDQIIVWSKTAGPDRVIGAVSLDGSDVQSGWTALDMDALGMTHDERFGVRDLLTGTRYSWQGARNFLRLDPATVPGHLFSIERAREGSV